MRKPADAMSKGLNSSNLAAAALQRHPIDRMQRGGFVVADFALAAIYTILTLQIVSPIFSN